MYCIHVFLNLLLLWAPVKYHLPTWLSKSLFLQCPCSSVVRVPLVMGRSLDWILLGIPCPALNCDTVNISMRLNVIYACQLSHLGRESHTCGLKTSFSPQLTLRAKFQGIWQDAVVRICIIHLLPHPPHPRGIFPHKTRKLPHISEKSTAYHPQKQKKRRDCSFWRSYSPKTATKTRLFVRKQF